MLYTRPNVQPSAPAVPAIRKWAKCSSRRLLCILLNSPPRNDSSTSQEAQGNMRLLFGLQGQMREAVAQMRPLRQPRISMLLQPCHEKGAAPSNHQWQRTEEIDRRGRKAGQTAEVDNRSGSPLFQTAIAERRGTGSCFKDKRGVSSPAKPSPTK